MTYAPTIADEVRIVNVTSTGTAQTLQALLDTALAAKSAPADTLPDKTLVQIALTPSADIAVSDPITQDEVTFSDRTILPLFNFDGVRIKNAATVSVELYYE